MSVMTAAPRETSSRPAFAGLYAEASSEPAIDLVHLARQTDNDPVLEEELLTLFDRQSASLLAQMSAHDAPPSRRSDAAHTLRGSALAIGAGAVARAAGALEASLERGAGGQFELEGLADAVREARAAIARLRG